MYVKLQVNKDSRCSFFNWRKGVQVFEGL
jgi:hypothetical protein